MKHIEFVVVLILRLTGDEPHLLMARRAEEKYMGGTWQLISGGIEPGEVAWKAALREMSEETGLSPQEFYRLSTLTHFYRPDNDSISTAPMFCALVEEHAEPQLNAEHTAFEWVRVREAASRLMWPSDREALEEICAVILENAAVKTHMRIPL